MKSWNGRFAPGHMVMPHHRRQRGTGNKMSRDLKEGIMEPRSPMASMARARTDWWVICSFLPQGIRSRSARYSKRLLPLQVDGNLNTFLGSINIMTVPEGCFLPGGNREEATSAAVPRHHCARSTRGQRGPLPHQGITRGLTNER
jgi:hypothetical protein